MNKEDAYRIVFNDMLFHGPNLFMGIYDAKNGSDKYMCGISTVLEFIASKVSDETHQAFTEIFNNNMLDCIRKARQNEV